MTEKTLAFTLVFEGNIREFTKNPLTTETPFGIPYAVAAFDALERIDNFNCTFVDDDMKVLVSLAQRAVLAGLAKDFPTDMQHRFLEASEKHRADHERCLGFPILKTEIRS